MILDLTEAETVAPTKSWIIDLQFTTWSLLEITTGRKSNAEDGSPHLEGRSRCEWMD